MTPEVHAVILWSTALDAADRIVADLRERFELVGSYRVEWTPERFGQNLRRLYGFALPERVDKTVGSGTDPFLLYVVRDPAPAYGVRQRSSGLRAVNVTTYDAKARYRDWTGGGFRVHTTIDKDEAERDVFLLLGRQSGSFADAPALDWERVPDPWRNDVLGADGWASRAELLSALELTTGYVVLREPDTLLVGDATWARDLAGAGESLELTEVGDGSLHPAWQRAIVREAVVNDSGTRVATPEHRFYARLHDAAANGLPVPAVELAELAREAQAPEGPYDDPAFVRAVLAGFLGDNGWAAPERRGRRFLGRRG